MINTFYSECCFRSAPKGLPSASWTLPPPSLALTIHHPRVCLHFSRVSQLALGQSALFNVHILHHHHCLLSCHLTASRAAASFHLPHCSQRLFLHPDLVAPQAAWTPRASAFTPNPSSFPWLGSPRPGGTVLTSGPSSPRPSTLPTHHPGTPRFLGTQQRLCLQLRGCCEHVCPSPFRSHALSCWRFHPGWTWLWDSLCHILFGSPLTSACHCVLYLILLCFAVNSILVTGQSAFPSQVTKHSRYSSESLLTNRTEPGICTAFTIGISTHHTCNELAHSRNTHPTSNRPRMWGRVAGLRNKWVFYSPKTRDILYRTQWCILWKCNGCIIERVLIYLAAFDEPQLL